MESKAYFFDPLIERVEEYGKTNYDLYKLKAVDKTSGVTSSFLAVLLVCISLLLFLVFAGIGASVWLGELFGKLYYGFLCVSAFYAVVACVLYFVMYDWIKKRIGNAIVSQMLN